SAPLVLRGKSYGQQRDGISLVRRGRGDRLQGSYVARGREGEQDDTEGAELTSFQGARGAVGSITQIAHGRKYALPSLGHHTRAPVGHARHRLCRDTGQSSHIRHGDPHSTT